MKRTNKMKNGIWWLLFSFYILSLIAGILRDNIQMLIFSLSTGVYLAIETYIDIKKKKKKRVKK